MSLARSGRRTIQRIVAGSNLRSSDVAVHPLHHTCQGLRFRKLEVILTTSIDKLGKAGETVKVAPGYFRNHLMPKLLAVPNIEKYAYLIREQRKIYQPQEEEEGEVKVVTEKTVDNTFREYEKAAKRLDKTRLVLRRLINVEKLRQRATKDEPIELQKPVTKDEIVSEVARQLCVQIEPVNVHLPSPITNVGEYEVPLLLPKSIPLPEGLAGTLESWGPQIQGLTGTDMANDVEVGDEVSPDEEGIQVCAFDNRGAGRSSLPVNKSEYSTAIMAKDAISVMDHLGWRKAHVFGHSMGGMIACKLAALVPARVSSLALLNVTGGGFECFPKFDLHTISTAFRFFRAKTPEKRAAVDLDTHYSKEYLDGIVGSTERREILHQEYVKALSARGMQSDRSFWGQANACWTHKLTRTEIESISSAGFPISIIHGRQDIVAQISHARNLARKLQPVAKMIELQGGHLVSHERVDEVNKALRQLIGESELNNRLLERPPLTKRSYGYMETGTSIQKANVGGEISIPLRDIILDRLNLCIWYFFGWFVLAIEHGRRLIGGPTAIIKVADSFT